MVKGILSVSDSVVKAFPYCIPLQYCILYMSFNSACKLLATGNPKEDYL